MNYVNVQLKDGKTVRIKLSEDESETGIRLGMDLYDKEFISIGNHIINKYEIVDIEFEELEEKFDLSSIDLDKELSNFTLENH